MSAHPIHNLCRANGIPGEAGVPELIETHISWVLIGEQLVYKFKKPIRYSFLDFSTVGKRKYYCEREVVLNRRLTTGIYLGVAPVWGTAEGWMLERRAGLGLAEVGWRGAWSAEGDSREGDASGAPVDYAVLMRKMDPMRRMDILARKGRLSMEQIDSLALVLANFHRKTEIFRDQPVEGDVAIMQALFNDLGMEAGFLGEALGNWASELIRTAMVRSDTFLMENAARMADRRNAGLFRDGHGDLHCRNIFLPDRPQVFDCIEFNDKLRRVDVLNDIAFLCMDLDSLGLSRLAERFIDRYMYHFPEAIGIADIPLLIYYKSYRANIRAKINSLRARSAGTAAERQDALDTASGYLRLMAGYV